ncbi:MAG: hypothetical protein NZ942_03950 [Candidatus Aenigmarchaeota archaeon]|nr:hypothetical protein [Candidatus Aenigmarchaeota archaeon]
MRLKAVLAVVIVLAIVALLFFTDSGKRALEFFGGKISETASFILGQNTKTFKMSLEVSLENRKSFYGKSFSTENSNFSALSVYNFISVDGGVEKVSGKKRIEIELKGLKGKLEISSLGTLRISGEANYIRIGDYERSREKPYQVEIEALPFDCSPACNFKVDNIKADLSFSLISGEVKKLKDDGVVDQIKYLREESLIIQKFVGSLELKDNLTLSGEATQVRGIDFLYTG